MYAWMHQTHVPTWVIAMVVFALGLAVALLLIVGLSALLIAAAVSAMTP